MDSQNGIDQDKVEQGEVDSFIINKNLETSEQCSSSTDKFDVSCPNTLHVAETEFGGGEPVPGESCSTDNDVLKNDQISLSCDGDLQSPKHSGETREPQGLNNEGYLSNPSPVSNNSGGSGVEIALDPVSADDAVEEHEHPKSSTNEPSVDQFGDGNVHMGDIMEHDGSPISKDPDQPGPSEDREDISDEEFDLQEQSSENTGEEKLQNLTISNPHPIEAESFRGALSQPMESSVDPVAEPLSSQLVQPSESVLSKGDIPSSNSSEGGEIIDLKLEDAVMKSSGSSFDEEENKASKASQEEDLEAVSDDELPSVPLQESSEPCLQGTSNLFEGGEQVSSSDEEAHANLRPVSSFSPSLNPVDSQCGAEPITVIKNEGDFMQERIPDCSLQSLDAEPISDEEDMSQGNMKSPTAVEGGEAGEIKSPEIGSPISEQEDLMLGEVEPISAEDDTDTDGELPSGDENSNSAGKMNQANTDKFEYIESDEEIVGDTKKSEEHSKIMSLDGNSSYKKTKFDIPAKDSDDKDEYMETISDEEDVQNDDSLKKEDALAKNSQHSSSNLTFLHNKEEEFEKRISQSNFNEHQVELDYEEAEGDDVDQKPLETGGSENANVNQEIQHKEGGEDGEVDEDEGSGKDEGELSDDDCEEGEIKEPGSKKPFIKPVCRFFQRGNCTWGLNCRFIHPGVNDKGNYQMIEIPGFKPVGVHARLGGPPGQWPEGPPEEEVELPPPPMPDVPHTETAWERGLRIAKEQRKKASERKEQEPDFEEKRLNLSVDEERELNKENERMPKIIPKDPYYDQQAYEFDEYYKVPQDPWHAGHYDNFEVRYQREPIPAYSPQFRVSDKPPPVMPPPRYNRHISPPIDKFGRQRDDRREPERPEQRPVGDFPSAPKPPDQWTDPWRRSKSPKQRKPRPPSRGKRSKRSLSDSSNSSRSGSRSSSGSSRSSRSGSGSSGSSSRSRSPGPGHPAMGRMERPDRPDRPPDRPPDRYGDQPRSMVSVRGHGNYNNYDNYRHPRGGRGYDGDRNMFNSRQGGQAFGGRGNHYNSFGGGRGGRGGRDPRDHRGGRGGWGGRPMRHRSPTPDRPLPYVRPRRKSASSRSSSSRSRSRSRSKYSDSSRSRSSSASSRSSSSSSSSAGSADSEHLYRDLDSPSRNPRSLISAPGKLKQKQRSDSHRERGKVQSTQRHNHHHSQQQPPLSVDRIPHPREPHTRDPHPRDLKSSQIPLPPPGSGRTDSKYASRNAPQAPVKPKDPLKVVGQKSNIKLTLLPKQQQQAGLPERPNPLASPPHKRRLPEREGSPPAKRVSLPVPQTSALRLAADKAAKIQMRSGDKAKSPPPSNASAPSSNQVRSKSGVSPQKQPSSKSRPPEAGPPKPVSKNVSAGAPAASGASKAKKSMSSRREELLKQLKAVEDAIARKKSKLP